MGTTSQPSETKWKTVESGVRSYKNSLHPVVRKNFGRWKYHERPRPGVLKHVAESGDAIYTVRAASQRQITVDVVRKFCDIAEKYADGFLRWTVRNNVEFLTPNWDHVEKIIGALEAMGHPVGGTGNSISGINHTQGWLHCDIPATDGSGVAKAVMDELVQEFIREEMPNRVRLSTSCCAINCGGQSDLAIIIQHTRPPRIDHDKLSNICELPKVVARCPVAAIRPVTINGKRSLIVEEAKCVVCGACFAACPSMEINHPEHSKLAVWVGGKHSSTRSKPSRMKLVAHGLPNNPPRWPEVMDVVKRILYAYKEGGRGYERLGEWIDRIGWKKFFGVTELTFDENMIDSYRLAQTSWNHSTHIRFP